MKTESLSDNQTRLHSSNTSKIIPHELYDFDEKMLTKDMAASLAILKTTLEK
jgi:hypothetical protein